MTTNSFQGLIFDIQRMSTEDGPGIRTTVFMKQCNLKCIWCHNPESILKTPQLEWFKHKCIRCNSCIDTCNQEALVFDENGLNINRELCNLCEKCVEECPSTALNMIGKWWNVDDLFFEIEKDKVYYNESKGGITISGGEPTLQSSFLLQFLKKTNDNGISTALDTCGYNTKEVFAKILPYIELVLFDVKLIDNKKHKEFTGESNMKILENAIWISEYLKRKNKVMWIRTPIIPNYTADEENIQDIGKFIVNKLKNSPERWDLLAFNNLCASKYDRLGLNWKLKDELLMTNDQMENLDRIAKKTGVKNVHWSGLTRKIKKNIDKINSHC
ncbi:MAG: glycyl-radical enzyme activating protein [Promethearchaeota archaeon]